MMPNAFADSYSGIYLPLVELIKDTKIQTPTRPWGLSAVGGLIISLSIPHSPLYPIGEWIGSPLPSTKTVRSPWMQKTQHFSQIPGGWRFRAET